MATTTIPSIAAMRANMAAAADQVARRDQLRDARTDVEDIGFFLTLVRARVADGGNAASLAAADKTLGKIERLLDSIDEALVTALKHGRWS